MPRYYRVVTYTGDKDHYAVETSAGTPYSMTICGITWKKKKGPAAQKLPTDCDKCQDFTWRPFGDGTAKVETLNRSDWIKKPGTQV